MSRVLALAAFTLPYVLAAGCMVSLVACGAPVEDGVLLEPDPEAQGALGTRGPFGARVERRKLTPEQGGSVLADVFVPFVREGADPCPCAPFLFVQGGSVAVERYRWIGAHLASRGLVVAAATHPVDIAFFAVDHTERALGGLRATSADEGDALFGKVADLPAIVAGHSLGGVVATKTWAQTEPYQVQHLVLLASFPQEGERVGDRGGRVLSIVGARDRRSEVAEVQAGAEAFEDAQVVVVDGMNHYQWTDDAKQSELESDGEATEETDVVRGRALAFIDALVNDVRGAAFYPFDDEGAWPEGTHAP
jgi:Alpha/beta hydrolase family